MDRAHEHAESSHGHGDHIAMFRRWFWWSLLLTIPVVVTSEMVMTSLGWFDLEFCVDLRPDRDA